jgi:hypothetical protein
MHRRCWLWTWAVHVLAWNNHRTTFQLHLQSPLPSTILASDTKLPSYLLPGDDKWLAKARLLVAKQRASRNPHCACRRFRFQEAIDV